MKNLEYRCIGNIANIPDWRDWSEQKYGGTNVNTNVMDPALRHIRVTQRTKTAKVLEDKYGYKDTMVFGEDVLDFVRWAVTDPTPVQRISDLLGIGNGIGRIQLQNPGQMVMLHQDDLRKTYFGELQEMEHWYQVDIPESDKQKFAQDPLCATRVLITLEDWRPGQGFGTEHGLIANWRAGDVFAWEWPTAIHSTFNSGYWPRPLLRVTGMVTDRWNNWFETDQQFQLDYNAAQEPLT